MSILPASKRKVGGGGRRSKRARARADFSNSNQIFFLQRGPRPRSRLKKRVERRICAALGLNNERFHSSIHATFCCHSPRLFATTRRQKRDETFLCAYRRFFDTRSSFFGSSNSHRSLVGSLTSLQFSTFLPRQASAHTQIAALIICKAPKSRLNLFKQLLFVLCPFSRPPQTRNHIIAAPNADTQLFTRLYAHKNAYHPRFFRPTAVSTKSGCQKTRQKNALGGKNKQSACLRAVC